jgi:hypothetical protein
MTDDAGNLSIDFLAGFTIFMIAFIYVATMIPGLFIGLQSRTIDYDAVAYRTGVILVEDPGMPYNPSWETQDDYHKDDVLRFGLALSKDTPGILSPSKVNRFFCTTWISDDYHSRAIFGDYPYQFNISFKKAGDTVAQTIGDETPDGYGSIRRVVKIKDPSNATIGKNTFDNNGYNSTANVTNDIFSIHINCTKLLNTVTNPAYQINPLQDQITITVIDLDQMGNGTLYTTKPTTQLSNVTIYRSKPISSDPSPPLVPVRTFDSPYVDNTIPASGLPTPITDNVTLVFPPGFFTDMADETTQLYVFLNFTHSSAEDKYLNNTWKDGITWNTSKSFEYDYNTTHVTLPKLEDGVLEVAVWSAGSRTSSGGSSTTSAPAITSISPTSGPLSGGTSVTITGSGFTGATAVTFGSTAATTFTVNSDTSITATSPIGSGVVDITVTTSYGTSATSSADQYTYVATAAPAVTGVSPSSGPLSSGPTVTITGSNLASATSVKFGTVEATILTNTAGSITVTPPTGTAGTVHVTVTTVGGTSATSSADQYTYVATAVPTFGTILPSTGTSDGGTSVTITGTNFVTGATSVTIGGNAATSVSVTSSTTLTAVTPSGSAGWVDVVVTTAGGSATGTKVYDYYTIQTFTTSTSWTVPSGVTKVDYVVVAGGGGGGYYGGGGGAGGFLTATGYSVTSGNVLTVTIGNGGAGSTSSSSRGTNGGNSVFATITATGGGGGASSGSSSGAAGGSGGGAYYGGSAGAGTSGQGYAGGIGVRTSSTPRYYYSGGGGGASAAGSAASGTAAGNGGAGIANSITGVTYAGGGGGGAYSTGTSGTGGSGIGGAGGDGAAGSSASANTGGGGGGGGRSGSGPGATSYSGGAGGSGIVIIKYY